MYFFWYKTFVFKNNYFLTSKDPSKDVNTIFLLKILQSWVFIFSFFVISFYQTRQPTSIQSSNLALSCSLSQPLGRRADWRQRGKFMHNNSPWFFLQYIIYLPTLRCEIHHVQPTGMIKFRYSEKATKIWKKIPLCFDGTNVI